MKVTTCAQFGPEGQDLIQGFGSELGLGSVQGLRSVRVIGEAPPPNRRQVDGQLQV